MLRVAFAALLVLSLAACDRAGSTAPFAESRTPPNLGPQFFPPDGWAWGYVQVGEAPPQRYGVASTSKVPRAVVLISPGYGETAETWFETVHDLTRQGCTVWVLDRAGQGGSGRLTLPRDLGYAKSFEPDVKGLVSLVRVVVRPRPGIPLILLGHDDGAMVVLRAVEGGLGADGLVLSSPRLEAVQAPRSGIAALPGLDRLPGAGWRPWSRSALDDRARGLTHDTWRGAVTQAWMTANPDLRMSLPGAAWTRAFAEASSAAKAEAGRIAPPVLMLTAGPANAGQADLCKAIRDCRGMEIAGALTALHLEADAWREPWRKAVVGFIAQKVDRSRDVTAAEDRPDSAEESRVFDDNRALTH